MQRSATDNVFPLTASRKWAKANKHARIQNEDADLQKDDEEQVAPKRGKASPQNKKVLPKQTVQKPSPPIKKHIKISKPPPNSEDSLKSQDCSPQLRSRKNIKTYMLKVLGKWQNLREKNMSQIMGMKVRNLLPPWNAKILEVPKNKLQRAKKEKRVQKGYPTNTKTKTACKQTGRIRNERRTYDEMVCLSHRVDEKYLVLYGKFASPCAGQDERNRAWQYVAGMIYFFIP